MKYDIDDMTDKALEIISDGLDSVNENLRMQTALQFTNSLTILAYSERLQRLERWADTVEVRVEKIDS